MKTFAGKPPKHYCVRSWTAYWGTKISKASFSVLRSELAVKEGSGRTGWKIERQEDEELLSALGPCGGQLRCAHKGDFILGIEDKWVVTVMHGLEQRACWDPASASKTSLMENKL